MLASIYRLSTASHGDSPSQSSGGGGTILSPFFIPLGAPITLYAGGRVGTNGEWYLFPCGNVYIGDEGEGTVTKLSRCRVRCLSNIKRVRDEDFITIGRGIYSV